MPGADLQLLGLLEEDDTDTHLAGTMIEQSMDFEFDKDGQIVELSPIFQSSGTAHRNTKRPMYDATPYIDEVDVATDSAHWKRPRIMANVRYWW